MSTLMGMGVGLLAGFIASILAGGRGPLLDIALGVIGAIAGVIASGASVLALNAAEGEGVPGFGVYSIGAAVIGALLVVSIYHRLIRG